MGTSRLNESRNSAKQSSWPSLRSTYRTVNLLAYSNLSAAKPLSISHDRTSSTDFAEISITACCLKVGTQERKGRIESILLSRRERRVQKKTDLCSSNGRSFLGQIHVSCVCSGVVWRHSPLAPAVCGHSRGKNQ